MAKIRKSIIAALMCLVLLFVGVCALTACGSDDLTVTFSIEGKEQVVEVVDGKVTFPNDPVKEFYEFRGWYTTETFDEGTEFTADTKISKSIKVYAYFVPIYIDITLNGGESNEIKLSELSAKTTEYSSDADSKNLTFDGWYVDAGYTTKYTTQDTDKLYGRYMAQVTFDNGYEVVYTTFVTPETSVKKPDVNDVVKYYMSTEDISYQDADGNAFNFSDTISNNVTLTVLWKTPGIHYMRLEGTQKDYVVLGIENSADNFPVISILSQNVTVKEENGNVVENATVVSVDGNVTPINTAYSPSRYYKAYKWIFNEGIKYIGNMDFITQTNVEEIYLPSTLRVLENSFWNCSNLASFELPEGLEVLINCFWGELDLFGNSATSATNFEIGVPNSVINIDCMPLNLKFKEGAQFYYENNRLYKKDGAVGKILVSDYRENVSANGTVAVPEGVTGLQVGVFEYIDFTYLSLPSTLNKASYNEDKNSEKYKSYYTGTWLTDIDHVKNPNDKDSHSFAIVNKLATVEYVYFNTREYPEGFEGNAYLFTENTIPYTSLDDEKLVYIGVVNEGNINVSVRIRNTMMNTVEKVVVQYETGSMITIEDLLERIGVTEDAVGTKIKVESFMTLGSDFVSGYKNTNQYIDISYTYDVLGFTAEDNGDGTLTVTGFDPATAQNLGTTEHPGPYLVVIPETLNGKRITAIGNGAFKGNSLIAKIFISNGVETIGDEAFMNTSNLEYIEVVSGGLKYIGRSAFENAGCTFNTDKQEWEITSTLPNNIFMDDNKTRVQGVYISFPLANLVEIGAYAFKSRAIPAFQPVAGEENRQLIMFNLLTGVGIFEGLEEGTFLYQLSATGGYCSIIRYVKTETVSKPDMTNTEVNIDVSVFDVQYVATACGYYSDRAGDFYLACGYTMRRWAEFGSMMASFATYNNYVMRYEMMEGSVSYLKNIGVNFVNVSYVHENAFTDMDCQVANWYTYANDVWLSEEDVHNQNSAIFEEGWWEGRANSENEFMADAESTTTGC